MGVDSIMHHFLRHSEKQIHTAKPKDFIVTSAEIMGHQLHRDIEVMECQEAKEKILAHKGCPFTHFAFYGECEIEREWYYRCQRLPANAFRHDHLFRQDLETTRTPASPEIVNTLKVTILVHL